MDVNSLSLSICTVHLWVELKACKRFAVKLRVVFDRWNSYIEQYLLPVEKLSSMLSQALKLSLQNQHVDQAWTSMG